MKMLKNSKGSWDWFKIALPIFILLVGALYTTIVVAIDAKQDSDVADERHGVITETLKGKVDKDVMINSLLIEQQKSIYLKEGLDKQEQIGIKTLDVLQKLDTTIQLMQQEMKLRSD